MQLKVKPTYKLKRQNNQSPNVLKASGLYILKLNEIFDIVSLMQRAVSSLLVIFFILWILPLGYFIKPSQQKTFCDGQRGMCMCTMFMVKKAPSHSPNQISMPSGGSNHESSSSGGASNSFEAFHNVFSVTHSNIFPSDVVLPIPSLMLISPIEHVPKF